LSKWSLTPDARLPGGGRIGAAAARRGVRPQPLVDFRLGEEHYLRVLTDGDWAANDLGWQWSAGCGVDAQPWFRVVNPVVQGERFDNAGAYVRRWIPELAALPDRWIHRPWAAPTTELARAGIVLGETYPRPIVEHAFARERFLALAHAHLGHTAGTASSATKRSKRTRS
jgi:deoxyribodipyrimidine photo-lyase